LEDYENSLTRANQTCIQLTSVDNRYLNHHFVSHYMVDSNYYFDILVKTLEKSLLIGIHCHFHPDTLSEMYNIPKTNANLISISTDVGPSVWIVDFSFIISHPEIQKIWRIKYQSWIQDPTKTKIGKCHLILSFYERSRLISFFRMFIRECCECG
jgi:hypothetical protein